MVSSAVMGRELGRVVYIWDASGKRESLYISTFTRRAFP
jgi:hypothetical protein